MWHCYVQAGTFRTRGRRQTIQEAARASTITPFHLRPTAIQGHRHRQTPARAIAVSIPRVAFSGSPNNMAARETDYRGTMSSPSSVEDSRRNRPHESLKADPAASNAVNWLNNTPTPSHAAIRQLHPSGVKPIDATCVSPIRSRCGTDRKKPTSLSETAR